jgi:hypothetical protein
VRGRPQLDEHGRGDIFWSAPGQWSRANEIIEDLE